MNRPKFKGLVVDPAGDLDLSRSAAVTIDPPLAREGAYEIAATALNLDPYDWLLVDDAESFLDPRLSRHNAFRRFLLFRGNLRINTILAMKEPLEVPRAVRTYATYWIVNTLGADVDVVRWVGKAGLPSEPLPILNFWAGPRGGPFLQVTVKTLDFDAIAL